MMLLANELSLFTLVVDTQSFKKAALSAGISTPSLSKRITKLETDLGVQLLHRTTRRLSLTEAGRKLYLRARDINKHVNEALGEVSNYSKSISGHIRMTVPTISGELFLAEIIAEFCQKHPDISVELGLENDFKDLVKEGIDLAIRTGVLEDSSLIAQSVLTSSWVVCASPSYIQKYGVVGSLVELEQHNCLAYTYQSKGANEWRFHQGEQDFNIKISGNFSTNNAQALRKAALAGHGVVYVPKCSVYQDLERGDLQVLLSDYQPRSLGVYAVYPYTRFLPEKISQLIAHIKQGYQTRSHYF